MIDTATCYDAPVLSPFFSPCMLDIFKKDRTAYVHYIYAIIAVPAWDRECSAHKSGG